jgi:Ca2+-binding EF-hand superfamily protein
MTEDNQRALLARYSIVTQNTILMIKSSHLLSLLAPLALLLPAQAQDCDQDSCDGQERAQRTSTQSVQDPAPKPKRRQGTDRDAIKKRLLKKYDANGDGELDRKELAKARKDGALPNRGQEPQDKKGKKPQGEKGKKPQGEKGKKPKDGEGSTPPAKSFTREDYKNAKKKIDAMVAAGKVSQEDADKRLSRMRQSMGKKPQGGEGNTAPAKSYTREDFKNAKKKLDAMVAEGKVSQEDADKRLSRMRQSMGKKPQGQEPQPDGKRPERDAIKKRLLKKYDANGDGELDRKELAKARKDGALPGVGQRGKEPEGGEPQPDGKRPEREAIRKRILKKYDANGDGELSREEMAQARKDGALPGRGQGEKPQEGETKKPKEGEGETPKKRKGKRGKIG